jgi:hypothetical protein
VNKPLAFIAVILLAGIVSITTIAQQPQPGPQGVLVTNCVSVTPMNGSYRFTNGCKFIVEVAAAQPSPNGKPNGSDTFQLFPDQSHLSGATSLGMPRYWACSAPNGPMSASRHAAPMSNDQNVICPKGGNAGGVH